MICKNGIPKTCINNDTFRRFNLATLSLLMRFHLMYQMGYHVPIHYMPE